MKTIIILALVILAGCSRNREVVRSSKKADLTIAVALNNVEENIRATVHTNICINLFRSDGTLIRDTMVTSISTMQFITVESISEGNNFSVIIWTEDDKGDTIHSPEVEQFSITAEKQTTVTFTLKPRCGTIMFQLIDVPTAIDSLHLLFVSDSGIYETSQNRAKTTFMTLDNVPYGAVGNLFFSMVDENDSIVSDWDTLFTFTNQYFSAEFSLINNGSLNTSINIEEPASSVFTATGDTSSSIGSESGDLLISEFCATGGSSSGSKEFIEIYNPHNMAYEADSLRLVIGSKTVIVYDFVLASKALYVISTPSGSFWGSDTIASFDLSSTSGILSLSGDGELLDYVIYFNDEDAGWDKLSSSAHCSWVLTGESLTADGNNNGSQWVTAESEVLDKDNKTWRGTPGQLGK